MTFQDTITMNSVDVVVVGGGISGLFTAWRIANNTDMTVAVLEHGSRFGGRMLTCKMPGDFSADMGAMRYLAANHKLLNKLVSQLDLSTEDLFANENGIENSAKHWYRNHRLAEVKDIHTLYGVREEDIPFLVIECFPSDEFSKNIEIPPDGDFYKGIVTKNGQLAKDMSMSQYVTLSNNAELLNFGDPHYPLTITVADNLAWLNQFIVSGEEAYKCVKGGMELICKRLVSSLMSSSKVLLLNNHSVNHVEEVANGFVVTAKKDGVPVRYNCEHLVLACNEHGIRSIQWQSHMDRATILNSLLSKIVGVSAFKIYLTFTSPWWEEYGLYESRVTTDLPIGEVNAFGDRGKSGGYATILASFTYNHMEIFQGLNQPSAKRFTNKAGNIPPELVPSERLVNYVLNQLSAVLGCENAPEPVCAACKIWNDTSVPSANYQSRVGTDSNLIHWQSMKPFQDCNIYLAGDIFGPCVKTGNFIGWSEGALLTSERILCNYFGLKPFVEGISLENEWPKKPLSKL